MTSEILFRKTILIVQVENHTLQLFLSTNTPSHSLFHLPDDNPWGHIVSPLDIRELGVTSVDEGEALHVPCTRGDSPGVFTESRVTNDPVYGTHPTVRFNYRDKFKTR